MAALRREDFASVFAGLFSLRPRKPRVTASAESRKAREFANRVYKETKGPTPELKRLYAELLENDRREAERQNAA